MRRIAFALAVFASISAHAAEPALPSAEAVAPGVWMFNSEFRPNRQPDGTTVIFAAPAGLVVMDTGRHVWRRRAILDFAKSRSQPIVAIVNSHWHLDHVSGNPDLKAAFPKARVYASGAIDQALAGFLAKSAADAQPYLDSGKLPQETAEDIRGDLATIKAGQALRPDIVVEASGPRKLGGLWLQLNLASHAATAGDLWVYDPKTRVAAVGDLVTLPAPFLDTACAQGWSTALGQIWATPFLTLIPGHGRVMDRAQFAAYRRAFDALVDCAATKATEAECAAAWTRAVKPLLGADPADEKRAQAMTEYYVSNLLRSQGGASPYCPTPGTSGSRR